MGGYDSGGMSARDSDRLDRRHARETVIDAARGDEEK